LSAQGVRRKYRGEKMKNWIVAVFIWILLCPKGHPAYGLKNEPETGENMTANKFYILSPDSAIPRDGHRAECPVCSTRLFFKKEYIYEANQ